MLRHSNFLFGTTLSTSGIVLTKAELVHTNKWLLYVWDFAESERLFWKCSTDTDCTAFDTSFDLMTCASFDFIISISSRISMSYIRRYMKATPGALRALPRNTGMRKSHHFQVACIQVVNTQVAKNNTYICTASVIGVSQIRCMAHRAGAV